MQSFTVTFLTLGAGVIAAFLFSLVAVSAKPSLPRLPKLEALALGILVAALGLRVGLSGQGFELEVDAGTFKAWSAAVARLGVHGLYASEMMVDYPPIYLAILGIFGSVAAQIGLAFESPWFARLLVCGPIIFELATAFALARLMGIRSKVRAALLISGFLLLPHVISNSTLFGQVDAAPTFLIFAASIPLAQWIVLCFASPQDPKAPSNPSLKQLCVSAFLFVLAIMTKPIAILFGPIGLAVTLSAAVTSAKRTGLKSYRDLVATAAVSAVATGGIIWIAAGFRFDLALSIVDKYWATLGSYPYASLNAANFWGLIGKNWADIKQPLFASLPIAFPISIVGKCLLGLVIGLGSGLAILDLQRLSRFHFLGENRTNETASRLAPLESICYFGALQMVLIFSFADQMHERYLYSGATLLVIATALRPTPQKILLAALQSALVGLNQALFLDFHAVAKGYHIPPQEPWLLTLSASQIIFTCFFAWTAMPAQRKHEAALFAAHAASPTAAFRRHVSPQHLLAGLRNPLFAPMQNINAAESCFIGGLTLLAAILGFFQLGSCSSPETFWRPHATEDQQNLTRRYSLASPVAREDLRITGFFGLGKGSYEFRVSSDAVQWHPIGEMGHDSIFDAFTWKVLEQTKKEDESAKDQQNKKPKLEWLGPVAFLEIKAVPKEGDTVAFHEVGVFKSKEHNDPERRVQLTSVGVLTPDPLIDEQETIPKLPSYLNEMIFDEVYHVRSAYEEMLGIPITETSHPPFGKTTISAGISHFGNNPFGWRIVGTALGVLLVPLAWLLMRLISGNRLGAGLTALLFCFDFLRYSQTRMATLDGIVVFYILATMVLLLVYGRLLTAPAASATWKRVIVLFCTGTLFGLGIATKWSVIYFAPVIAILFLCFLANRLLSMESQPGQPGHPGLVQKTLTNTRELGMGLLCFVVWPLLLYYSAFQISHIRSGEGHTFADFWNRQVSMYRYHSELKATHPFSSRWWEWPIIKRPLWLYSGNPSPAELGPTRVRSIVAMGSPLIWWASFLAVAWCSVDGIKRLWRSLKGIPETTPGSGFAIFVVLLAFSGLYAPWIVSPRSLTFIYHYFPAVPFATMALTLVVCQRAKTWSSAWILLPAWIALASFVFFFPVLNGYPIDREFINVYLRWFPSWVF